MSVLPRRQRRPVPEGALAVREPFSPDVIEATRKHAESAPNRMRRDSRHLHQRQLNLGLDVPVVNPPSVEVGVDLNIGTGNEPNTGAAQDSGPEPELAVITTTIVVDPVLPTLPVVPAVPPFPTDLTVPSVPQLPPPIPVEIPVVPTYPFGETTAAAPQAPTALAGETPPNAAVPAAAQPTVAPAPNPPPETTLAAPIAPIPPNSTPAQSPNPSSAANTASYSVAVPLPASQSSSPVPSASGSTTPDLIQIAKATPLPSHSLSYTRLPSNYTATLVQEGKTVLAFVTSSGSSTWTVHSTLEPSDYSTTSEYDSEPTSQYYGSDTSDRGGPGIGGAAGVYPPGVRSSAAPTSTNAAAGSSSSNDDGIAPTPVIVGTTVGTVAGVILITLLALMLLKRRRRLQALQPLPDGDEPSMGERSRGLGLFPAAVSRYIRRASPAPVERGFQRISGRKLPSAFSAGMSVEEMEKRAAAQSRNVSDPFADPPDVNQNRALHTPLNSARPSSPTAPPLSAGAFSRMSVDEKRLSRMDKDLRRSTFSSDDGIITTDLYASGAIHKEAVQRPSPARTPTFVHSRDSDEALARTKTPTRPSLESRSNPRFQEKI